MITEECRGVVTLTLFLSLLGEKLVVLVIVPLRNDLKKESQQIVS